jgi:hypothetical protein
MLSEYSEKIEVHCTIPGGVLEWDFGSTRTLILCLGSVYGAILLCKSV